MATVQTQAPAVERYLSALQGKDLLIRLDWDQWLNLGAPYESTGCTRQDVTARDTPTTEDYAGAYTLSLHDALPDSKGAIVMFHGGAGSENIFDRTPDGRSGLGRVLASQGITALALTYPGHWSPEPGGTWSAPVPERMPIYLLDQTLPEKEILDRNLKCTFNVILQGAAALVDKHLAGRKILAFGHSTGGPMAAHLVRFAKSVEIIGIVGFGSGGPDGWRRQWRLDTGAEKTTLHPVDHVSRRSPKTFRASGYEDPPDLCPWGDAEGYINWAQRIRSQMKTSLCDNQHMGNIETFGDYAARTGLPLEEYADHMGDPDPAWLRKISVLLVVGDNDKGHWLHGDKIEHKREPWMGAKYRAHGVKRAHVTVMPRYGHVGYCELHNEKIAYLWLWAYKTGYFA